MFKPAQMKNPGSMGSNISAYSSNRILCSHSYLECICMALTTFKLEGEMTSLSESSQGEVGDNREKWGDFWEKLIVINRNIVSRPL